MDIKISNQLLTFDQFQSFIKEVEQDFVPPLLDRVNIAEFYNKVNSLAVLYGCYRKDELIGLCIFYANDFETKKAYVTFLAVDRKHRGNNIAGELLKDVCIYAKEQGMESIGLHTYNIIAKECYLKNGFSLKEVYFDVNYNNTSVNFYRKIKS